MIDRFNPAALSLTLGGFVIGSVLVIFGLGAGEMSYSAIFGIACGWILRSLSVNDH